MIDLIGSHHVIALVALGIFLVILCVVKPRKRA